MYAQMNYMKNELNEILICDKMIIIRYSHCW